MEASLFDTPASLILMVLTVGISLIAFNRQDLWRFLALEPYRMIRDREFHAVVTSSFVHGSGFHLALNMLTLFFFGPSLEAILGGTQFIIVYGASLLVSGIVSTIIFRNEPNYISIGASDAVSGVVFSFCLFEPMAQLYLFFVLPIPAFLFAFLFVGYSIYAMKRMDDRIAHEAHLAGAITGIIVTIILNPSVIEGLINEFF